MAPLKLRYSYVGTVDTYFSIDEAEEVAHPSFQHSLKTLHLPLRLLLILKSNTTNTYIMATEAKAQTELQDFESLFSLDGKVAVVVCRLFNSLICASCS